MCAGEITQGRRRQTFPPQVQPTCSELGGKPHQCSAICITGASALLFAFAKPRFAAPYVRWYCCSVANRLQIQLLSNNYMFLWWCSDWKCDQPQAHKSKPLSCLVIQVIAGCEESSGSPLHIWVVLIPQFAAQHSIVIEPLHLSQTSCCCCCSVHLAMNTVGCWS